jgi:hypothetical protein
MKTTLLRLTAVALIAFVTSCAHSTRHTARNSDRPHQNYTGPTLLVEVDVPPTWRPFLDEDIAEAFAERLQEVFSQRGFQGRVKQIDNADKKQPRENLNILTLFLTEWRVDRAGFVQCTFTASIRTPAGEKNLGIFTATSIQWVAGRNRWALADAFDEAARNALNDLYDQLQRSNLLPGATR